MPYPNIIYRKELARRKLNEALLAQAISPDKTQMVSGRVVPYSPIQGISKIAQALLARQGINAADAGISKAEQDYNTKSQAATQKVMDVMQGQELPYAMTPNQNLHGGYSGVTAGADPTRAALMAASDPNIPPGVSNVFTAMMKARSKGQSGKPIYTGIGPLVPDPSAPQGYSKLINPDTHKQYPPLNSDPNTLYRAKNAQELGGLDAKMQKEPQLKAAIKRAETDAKLRAEMAYQKPISQNSLQNTFDEVSKIKGFINEAIPQADGWTTGLMSQALSSIGSTTARNLRGTLDSIKASIGLEALVALKKQGGTMGQVSNEEEKLLQDKWTSLDQAATKEVFVKRLNGLLGELDRLKNRSTYAYENIYGEPFKAVDTSVAPASQQAIQQPSDAIAAQPANNSNLPSPPPGFNVD